MKLCWLANSLDKTLCYGGTFVSIYYFKAFKQLGYDIDLLSWENIRENYESLKGYDVVGTLDYAIDPIKLKKIAGVKKTFFYNIDEPELYKSPLLGWDYYFTNSRGAIPLHEKLGRRNVHWLPFACPEVFYPIENEKILDVVYVGNGIATKSYDIILEPVAQLADEGKLKLHIFGQNWNKPHNIKYRRWVKFPVPNDKIADIYSRAKIVLNMHRENQRQVDGSFIMRDWEARGCATFLLSDSFEGCEYFGEEQVFSSSPEETRELIEYFLDPSSEEERNEIAQRGYSKIKKETYIERVKQVAKVVGI